MPLDQPGGLFTEGEPYHCLPLTGDRYAECVEIYEAASDQRALLQHGLGQRIAAAFAGRAVRMLSVGSGSGVFDAGLLECLAPKLDTVCYTGIDPNPRQCELAVQRMARLSGHKVDVRIVNALFDSSRIRERYDIVCFVHCLYYFDEPETAIDAALEALVPGGQLIIAHAPNEALNALADRFWSQQNAGRRSWFSDDIFDALVKRGMSPVLERIDARLDAGGCAGGAPRSVGAKAATDTGRAIADFIAQVEIAQLPAMVQAEIFEYLGAIVQSGPHGARYFHHPVDVLSIVQPPVA